MDIKEKQIITEQLFSTKEDVVLSAIETIRENGDVTFLESILQLFNSTKELDVKNAIQELLNDLKDIKAVPIIMEAIKNTNYKSITKDLLISCWMSGLDYTDFFNIFVDIFITSEFLTAFEAFTIMDNSELPDNIENIEQLIDKLENAGMLISLEKQQLKTDLIQLFNNYIQTK